MLASSGCQICDHPASVQAGRRISSRSLISNNWTDGPKRFGGVAHAPSGFCADGLRLCRDYRFADFIPATLIFFHYNFHYIHHAHRHFASERTI